MCHPIGNLARMRELDLTLGLAGADALTVARRFANAAGTEKGIGFAAANAIVRWILDRAGYRPQASVDLLGALDLQPGDHVGMIGLFAPPLRRVLA